MRITLMNAGEHESGANKLVILSAAKDWLEIPPSAQDDRVVCARSAFIGVHQRDPHFRKGFSRTIPVVGGRA
jgi:hypothetical protein